MAARIPVERCENTAAVSVTSSASHFVQILLLSSVSVCSERLFALAFSRPTC